MTYQENSSCRNWNTVRVLCVVMEPPVISVHVTQLVTCYFVMQRFWLIANQPRDSSFFTKLLRTCSRSRFRNTQPSRARSVWWMRRSSRTTRPVRWHRASPRRMLIRTVRAHLLGFFQTAQDDKPIKREHSHTVRGEWKLPKNLCISKDPNGISLVIRRRVPPANCINSTMHNSAADCKVVVEVSRATNAGSSL